MSTGFFGDIQKYVMKVPTAIIRWRSATIIRTKLSSASVWKTTYVLQSPIGTPSHGKVATLSADAHLTAPV